VSPNTDQSRDDHADHGPWLFSAKGELVSSLIAGGLLLAGFGLVLAGEGEIGRALYWVSLGIGLIHGLRTAWASLQERRFDIDVLMAVAALLAAAMNSPAEGALLLFLFVLAGALEELAMQRTTRAVEALHRLMPTKALALDDARGVFVEVPPETLGPGRIIKVPPGELIPVDALVLEGRGSVDQANLTGESMPRSVRPGDEVYAGTVNVGDPLRLRVTRPAAESSLQRILNLVTQAQQQREPVQRFIDRVSQPYAIGVMGVSVAVFGLWWLALGESVWDALYTAMTLLIVMSPCAVIIATPTATLTGIARAARGGVLFKGGQAIERLARLRAVAFDKTGTLTVGRPRVRELHAVGWSDAEALLRAAAGLEQDSTHPIAAAVRDEASRRGLAPAPVGSPGFTPGRGVSGEIDGLPARLGNEAFTRELIPVCLRERVHEVLSGVQSAGQIGVVVAHDQQAGVIILADSPRPGAGTLVRELHAMGVKPVIMLTGDNELTAASVAKGLGLDRYKAQCLPGDKVDAIGGLKDEVRSRGGGVGVIGDGVNDAPALAAADVSIAIGSIGSDAALESADIVLLSDDLGTVPWALGLAKRTRRTITINLCVALGAILVMAIATLVGSRIDRPLPLWVGVLGHEGGTILVVAHSLLLLLYPAAKGVGSLAEADDAPAEVRDDSAEVGV
jgi:Cd2+/Zn2+-exporting ATPase